MTDQRLHRLGGNRLDAAVVASALGRRVGGVLRFVACVGQSGHSISDDEFMGALSSTSKYNADWDFLIFLRDQGRKCAGDWLAKNFAKLGVESSVDIHSVYL